MLPPLLCLFLLFGLLFCFPLGVFPLPVVKRCRQDLGLLTKWFSKKSVLKKVQEKVISAIKTEKTRQENQTLFSK